MQSAFTFMAWSYRKLFSVSLVYPLRRSHILLGCFLPFDQQIYFILLCNLLSSIMPTCRVVVILTSYHLIICIMRRSLNVYVNIFLKVPLSCTPSEATMSFSSFYLMGHRTLYLAICRNSRVIIHFLARILPFVNLLLLIICVMARFNRHYQVLPYRLLLGIVSLIPTSIMSIASIDTNFNSFTLKSFSKLPWTRLHYRYIQKSYQFVLKYHFVIYSI